jgi:diguanylate cyclase (GGDEF)-like protein
MSVIHSQPDILKRDRVLVVGGEASLSQHLRDRYPDCEITTADTLLQAIENLTQRDARAVIACVKPSQQRLIDAVAGLREAAGERTKVVLCCAPEAEPQVRKAVASGADDYLVFPLQDGELDRALGYGVSCDVDGGAAPPASTEELKLLGDILAKLDEEPFKMLSRLTDLVRLAIGAQSATLVAEGSAANSGGTVINPVLIEPIARDGKTVGQISLGPRPRPYGADDVERLKHYARLCGHILSAAARQRRWRTEAMSDPVSGLRNRRYLREFLKDLLGQARDQRFRVTVLLFDIDDFKSFNDTYGHAVGDEIIRCIGELFMSHCREHDVVTRHGGDEFCVVFWDADQPRVAGSTHPTDALSVLNRFTEALRSYKCDSLGPETRGRITISGGLASFPWDASTPEELVEKADQALLAAKRAGKNQVLIFGKETLNGPACE